MTDTSRSNRSMNTIHTASSDATDRTKNDGTPFPFLESRLPGSACTQLDSFFSVKHSDCPPYSEEELKVILTLQTSLGVKGNANEVEKDPGIGSRFYHSLPDSEK